MQNRAYIMRCFSLAIGLILLHSLAVAQKYNNSSPPYEYDFLGKGARAAGMSYAFTAIADDVTAINWNPAGIAQITHKELTLSYRIIFPDIKHYKWSTREYPSVHNLEYIGMVIPLKLRGKTLTLGASYQNQINYNESYKSYSERGVIEENYENNITLNTISSSIAYAVTPYLHVGVSLHTWFSLNGNKEYYSIDYNEMFVDENDTVYFDLTTESSTQSKYFGMSMSYGILMDFSSLGFPMRFAMKYESQKRINNEFQEEYLYDHTYPNGSHENFRASMDGDRLYTLNNQLSLGLSYRLGDYFTLACDFDYKPYKNDKYLFTGNDFNDLSNPIVDTAYSQEFLLTESNADMHQFRFGAEYIIHTEYLLMPVRAGWKTNPTNLALFFNKEAVDQVYAKSFSLGFGLVQKRYSIDMAYEYYTYRRMDRDSYMEYNRYHFLILSVIFNF